MVPKPDSAESGQLPALGASGYTPATSQQRPVYQRPLNTSLREAATHISGIGRKSCLNTHPRVFQEASPGGPSCTYLLILVIAGLRVGLGSGGWWWGVGGRIVGAIAPIVVGRWWWRWRRWGCVALGVASLVVGWLAVTRLSRERDKSSMRDSTHRY